MANLQLNAQTALNGYDNRFGNTRLYEISNLSIFSVALSHQRDAALASIKSALGATWPETGKSTFGDSASNGIMGSTDQTCRLLGMQADQVFALFVPPEAARTAASTAASGSVGDIPDIDHVYITDQSDSWAALALQGDNAVSALERICPLDLHPTSFAPNQVARTVMEHLAVIILCESENHYVLLSPRSSANSFLHAVEQSLRNVSQ